MSYVAEQIIVEEGVYQWKPLCIGSKFRAVRAFLTARRGGVAAARVVSSSGTHKYFDRRMSPEALKRKQPGYHKRRLR